MTGKTKRAALVLLAAALLIGSFAGCGKNNPSVLKLPDTTAAAEATPQGSPAPLTPLGDRSCRVSQETIPESTLFSFLLNEANFDPLVGLTLKFTSTNKAADRDFVVSLNHLSVNGYMQAGDYEMRVGAGQSVLGEISISADELRASGVSSVDELILYPLIYDDAVPMGTGDVVDGAFSFYPTGHTHGTVIYPLRQKTTTEQTFFDNGFGTMVILSAERNDYDDLVVHSYLENKTDRFLSFSWSDVTVNDTPVSASGDAVVAAGMRRYATLTIPSAEISGRGITDPGSVAFKISATPLSNTGADLSPLMEQRGTYRFTVASTGTSGDGDTDPDSGSGNSDGGDELVAATPAGTATPAPTATVYKTPTSAQKKNAKNGYIKGDKVNMREGPGKNYKTVGKKIEQYTTVTLYELQDGWWFLKCGSHYGYVKSDYVAQGKPPKNAENKDKDEGDGKTFAGTVNTRSKAALRKSADKESKCLKELANGTKVTVYYKTKGKDDSSWYYVAAGKTKGYIKADLVKVSGKIPTK